MNLLESIEGKNKLFLLVTGFSFIGVVGVVDFLIGHEISFSVFYVIPISFVTWFTHRQFGLVAAFASAIAWLLADISAGHVYSHALIPIWNTIIRFSFFVIITLLLSELRAAMQREGRMARTDYLTGAVNGRFFYELAQMEMDRIQRYHHQFTLAYIDLDNFKTVNDKFGHTVGDEVLRTVVNSFRENMRRTDVVARLGGDEFALLFPETNQNSARMVLAKIQECLSAEMRQHDWPITCSIGGLTCSVAPRTTDELMKMADALMYQVKRGGKNAVQYSMYEG